MASEIQYFNSQEAAKILGVNVSTIKRWTEEGKLECIKTAGGHRKFLMEHLAKFLETHEKKKAKANLFPVEDVTDLELSQRLLKGDFPFLQDFLLQNALEVNRARLHQVFSGLYLGQYPLHEIYDQLITPVLHHLGDMWERGELTVIEEHLATQAIKDGLIRLQGQIRIPREKIGTALCLNLAGELHDLPLKMVDHILEQCGYQVLFSGQITPAMQMEHLFQKWKPQRVYISSIYVEDLPSVQSELHQILEIARQHGSQVYVGGRGFDQLSHNHPAVVARLLNFQEVVEV